MARLRLVPEILDQPFKWKRPRLLLVDYRAHLPHVGQRPAVSDRVPVEFLGKLYAMMYRAHDRDIPLLRDTPAVVRGLSLEPLLGPIDLRRLIATPGDDGQCDRCGYLWNEGAVHHECPPGFGGRIDWVIIGGESGPGARPYEIEWAPSLIEQCKAAEVALFHKQLGTLPVVGAVEEGLHGAVVMHAERSIYDEWPEGTMFGNPTKLRELNGRVALLKDGKGGDMTAWPLRRRVREFPET